MSVGTVFVHSIFVMMWCNWHYKQACPHSIIAVFHHLTSLHVYSLQFTIFCIVWVCYNSKSTDHNLQHFWFHFINCHKKNTINIELWSNEFQWRNLTVKIHLLKTKQTWCKSGVVKNVTEQHKVPHHISFGVKQLNSHGWRMRSKVILQEHISNYEHY